LLGDFNAKVGKEYIFKRTIGNESLHQISNDNAVRAVNFATSKNFIVQSTTFPHRNLHKFTWTSPDGKTHNQIEHIFCDTDHYLVVAKIRERLAVNKQTMQRVHMEWFNLKKVNEVESEEQHRVEISNRFTALENLDTEVHINRAWETIRENIKVSAKESLGYHELKKHKPWSMKDAQNY
jgi:uncharacterized protein YqjF (DUF2071 family)